MLVGDRLRLAIALFLALVNPQLLGFLDGRSAPAVERSQIFQDAIAIYGINKSKEEFLFCTFNLLNNLSY